MSIIVVEIEEELPTYSGRLDRLPSYNDIVERYRERIRRHRDNRDNKMSFEFIFMWLLIVFILFVLVVPFIVVGIKY